MPKVPGIKFLGSNGIFCFTGIWKLGSFKNAFATITFGTNKKNDFYELWQQHKLLKAMEMSKA